MTIWANYPATTSPINATNLLSNGWVSAGEIWTYSSVDDPTGVITIDGDVTTKYSLGMRIKFTNGGNVIYGIITAISYSSPNTTLTFLHEIDPTDSLALHLMANSAITLNYYSNMKAPFEFPMNPDKWTTLVISETKYETNNPSGNFINLGSLYIDVPIGAFKLSFSSVCVVTLGSPHYPVSSMGLSTSTTSITDGYLYSSCYVGSTSIQFVANHYKEKNLIISSKTRYYLIERVENSPVNITINPFPITDPHFRGNTVIKAVCAYL